MCFVLSRNHFVHLQVFKPGWTSTEPGAMMTIAVDADLGGGLYESEVEWNEVGGEVGFLRVHKYDDHVNSCMS